MNNIDYYSKYKKYKRKYLLLQHGKGFLENKICSGKEKVEKVTAQSIKAYDETIKYAKIKEVEFKAILTKELTSLTGKINDNFKDKFEIILKNNENIKNFFIALLATIKDDKITDNSINNIMQSHIATLKALINKICEDLEPKLKETTKNALDALEKTSKDTLIFVCNNIVKGLIMLIIKMPDLRKIFPHA
jgi:hypothetical protein